MGAIRRLQQRSNSVLLVEHDPECIIAADHIIEVGPKAGKDGGQIVFSDNARKWNDKTLSWANENLTAISPEMILKKPAISLKNSKIRNLKNLNFDLPLNSFVCLVGVSGSGKSTFAHEVLQNLYKKYKNSDLEKDDFGEASGFENIADLLLIDQSPISRSPRSTIGTYTELWEEIRTMLANTPMAQNLALSKSAFSFNVDGGRCPACKGAGFTREDMQFLSDIYVPCEVCGGKRFQPSILEVRIKGKNIFDLLEMTIKEAQSFFSDHIRINNICSIFTK